MPNKENTILNYIGDDGEFLRPIDEYAEEMLSGELEYSDAEFGYEGVFDLLYYRYSFHGWPWQRWFQYKEYQQLLHQLSVVEVRQLSWLARFARSSKNPKDIFGLIIVLLSPLMILAILTMPNSEPDDNLVLLETYRANILSSSGTEKRFCTVIVGADVKEIPVYNVTANAIEHSYTFSIDTYPTFWRVYATDDSAQWYQSTNSLGYPNETIVLAKYFDSITCGTGG